MATLSIILLNIFIAIVSVEYERLETHVVERYEAAIDRRLARLVRSRLPRAPRLGLSRSKAETAWDGWHEDSDRDQSQQQQRGRPARNVASAQAYSASHRAQVERNLRVAEAMHPIDWGHAPLPSVDAVAASMGEMFEENASLSDQVTNLAGMVRGVRARQAADLKTVVEAVEASSAAAVNRGKGAGE